jgi:hypothetical protein
MNLMLASPSPLHCTYATHTQLLSFFRALGYGWFEPQVLLSDQGVPRARAAFAVNLMVPLVVLLEGSGVDLEAFAARRRCCLHVLTDVMFRPPQDSDAFLLRMLAALGTAVGKTRRAAKEMIIGVTDPDTSQLPAAAVLLIAFFSYNLTTNPEGKRAAESWVPADPFLGPVYRKYSCRVCGFLPARSTLQFQVCSLCGDPAEGRFCSKTPCYAEYWRGGHKNTCAGRHKHKKKGAEGGGAGGGAARGSVAKV